MKKKRCALCYAVLAVCFALLLAVSVGTGSAALSPHEIVRILLLREGAGTAAYNVLLKIRLPRVLAALLAGAALATSGALIQACLDNPLASPNVIGVNSGAGLAVLLAASLVPGALWLTPLAAFIGALAAALIIFAHDSARRP